MKLKIAAALAAAALVALVAVRVAAVRRAAVKPQETPSEAALVTSARVARADVPDRIALTGTVRPRNEVDVLSKVTGRIESVHAQVGQRVKAGQLLAVVEHEEIGWQAKAAEAAVQVARASMDGARLDWARTEQLAKGGSASPAQLDSARVRRELAEAQLAQAEAAAGLARQQLANSRVVTPVAGTVVRRPVDVGAQVTLTTVLFTVQDVATLKLETSVDAAAFVRLARGKPAQVTVDALPGELFPGKVSLLSPALDSQSRRAAIEVEIDNAAGRLLPNMFAHAELTVGVVKGALVVPRAALYEAAGGVTVYRLRGGRAEAVQPPLGPSDGARVVVLSGLAEDDEVATSGLAALSDGAAVAVASPTAGARAQAQLR
jgi:membrane fusion protein, multidrug efflux system